MFVFTEIIGCAKVGRVALESYCRHHVIPVHVFATQDDIAELGQIGQNNLINFIDVTDDRQLVEAYKKGHQGTAYLFAKIIASTEITDDNEIIHFDGDVYFKKESLSLIVNAFRMGFDLVGSRRCYVNNPGGIEVPGYLPDVISTYFFGVKRDKIPTVYSFEDMVQMCVGNPIGLDDMVLDFFDPISFHIIKAGGDVKFLDYEFVGGQNDQGSKISAIPANLHLDAGEYLLHFGGTGSGYAYYRNKNEQHVAYGDWALIRWSLFSMLFYNEPVPVDAPESVFDENGRWISGNYNEKIMTDIKNAIHNYR